MEINPRHRRPPDSRRGKRTTAGNRTANTHSREGLIERVREGTLTPAEAEAEALRESLPPLRGEADPGKFDPMAEVWWSLPMVVAWIAWRSPEAVREEWDEYRRESWVWSATRWTRGPGEPIYEGFELERRPHATWTLLKLAASNQPQHGDSAPEYVKVAEARLDLWKALGEGPIFADAIDVVTGKRIRIPAEAWSDLRWFEERERNVLRVNALDAAGYNDVRLKAEDVMGAWSATPPSIDRLPDTVRPTGPGFMPLYCAIQWIATQGDTIKVGPSPSSVWDQAYSELLARIASGEVVTTGIDKGRRQQIDPLMFADISVEHPFAGERSDLRASTELYLCSFPYVDDRHWRRGFDDSLKNRYQKTLDPTNGPEN